MARIRTVKPELADDEKLGSVCRDARLLFIMMWCHSDDFGVVKGNLCWLQSQIFPYDSLKPTKFQKWIKELVNIDAIRPFEKNGEKFFYIKNFQKHQVINKPSKQARNPEPPKEILPEDSRRATVVLPEDYAEEGKGRERKGREQEGKGKGEDVSPPSFPEKIPRPKTTTGTPGQEAAWQEFKNLYPKRRGKFLEEQETFRRFCLIPENDWPQVLKAAANYAESERVKDGIGIRDPKNFLGDQMLERPYWREWLEPEKEPEDNRFKFLEGET